MAKDYRTTKHRKFLVHFHIILVVKYRKQLMFKFGRLIKSYLEIYAAKTNVDVEIAESDKDHLHMLICLNSLDFNIEKWIIGFKQYTTNQLYYHTNPEVVEFLESHFWNKNTFWSDGAFVGSIGNVSQETIKQYIESQG
jgi:putative transposase